MKVNLVIRATRQSPRTDNDGVSQAAKLTSAFVQIKDASSDDEETEYRLETKIYSSSNTSRYEPYQSAALHQMLQDLRNYPPEWNAIILFNDTMRIAEGPEDVDFFVDTVERLRPGTEVRTLAEYGLNPKEVSRINKTCSDGHRAISAVASHRNAGKSVPITFDAEVRDWVEKRVKAIRKELLSDKDSPLKAIVQAAKARGEAIPNDPEFDSRWRAAQQIIAAAATPRKRDLTLRREAQTLIADESTRLASMLEWILIYIRDSPPRAVWLVLFMGIPIDQLAWNMALAEARHGPNYGNQLVILHENKSRTNQCNPRFGVAAKELASGAAKCLIMKASNRGSVHSESMELLLQVGLLKAGREEKARVEFSMHVGQESVEIVRSESSRKAKKQSVVVKCKDQLADLRSKLDSEKRRFSERMLKLYTRRLSIVERSVYAEKLGLSADYHPHEEDSDDEDDCLACVCGKIHIEVFSIQCACCDTVYNVSQTCVGFDEGSAHEMGDWFCVSCEDYESE